MVTIKNKKVFYWSKNSEQVTILASPAKALPVAINNRRPVVHFKNVFGKKNLKKGNKKWNSIIKIKEGEEKWKKFPNSTPIKS